MTIKRLLDGHPVVAREIKEILRARVHPQELTRRSDEASARAADAEQNESNVAVKLDPAGHRSVGFGL